jgi:hypothetical protein
MAIKKEIDINVVSNAAKATKDIENLNKEIQSVEKNTDKLKVVGEKAFDVLDQSTGGYLGKTRELLGSIKSLASSFNILTVAKKAYAKVVGTATGLTKAFKIAVASTGIGLLVVGLGLLIANFEKISKWVTDVTEKFGGWRNVLMIVAPPIWAIVKALEALGIIDDKQTADAKKNAAERLANAKKESAELDKRKKATEEYYDLEIRKAKAAGKNTEEVEAQKRRALLETLKAQNELERSWIRTSQATEEDVKRWNERQATITKLLQDIEVAGIEQKRKEDDAAKEKAKRDADAAQKAIELRKAEQKALLDIETNFRKQLEDLEDTTELQKLERAKARQLAEIEQMKGTETDKQKARLQIEEFYIKKEKELKQKQKDEDELLEKQKNKRIDEIRAEFDFKRRELEAQSEQDKLNLELEKVENERIAKENELIALGLDLDARLEILKAFEIKKANLQADFLADEQERERLVQDSKVQMAIDTFNRMGALLDQNSKAGKSFAIAQALINTYQGITAELQTETVTPYEFGIKLANVATTAAMGFKAVKNIMKTRPGATATSGDTSMGSSPTQQAPIFNFGGTDIANQIAQTLGQQQPVQAYVVANDVTTAQSLDRNIITSASLG